MKSVVYHTRNVRKNVRDDEVIREFANGQVETDLQRITLDRREIHS